MKAIRVKEKKKRNGEWRKRSGKNRKRSKGNLKKASEIDSQSYRRNRNERRVEKVARLRNKSRRKLRKRAGGDKTSLLLMMKSNRLIEMNWRPERATRQRKKQRSIWIKVNWKSTQKANAGGECAIGWHHQIANSTRNTNAKKQLRVWIIVLKDNNTDWLKMKWK